MPDLLDCLTQGSKNLPIPGNSGKPLSLENIVVDCALIGLACIAGNALFGKKNTRNLLNGQIGNLFQQGK